MKGTKITHNLNEEFTLLEARIQAALKPVTPSVEFTRSLKRRLMVQGAGQPAEQQSAQSALFISLLGYISAVFMAAVSIRAFVALISGVAMLLTFRRQMANSIRRV
jgi:hypothetical protein